MNNMVKRGLMLFAVGVAVMIAAGVGVMFASGFGIRIEGATRALLVITFVSVAIAATGLIMIAMGTISRHDPGSPHGRDKRGNGGEE